MSILMFCELQNAFLSITSAAANNDYTEKQKHFITRLPYQKYEKVLSMITGQTPIKDREYSIYKQLYDNLKFDFISNVINTDNNEYHTVIDSTTEHLLLNALSPQCLCNYILDNYSNKYIFLTLNYGSNLHDSAHQSAIMIDNKSKKIYMIDPNGKSDFFDHVFHEPTNFYVETILSKYFGELNRLGLKYEYVYTQDWNPSKMALNKNFKDKYIGSGHCVITTLMLIHLISIFNINPQDAFNMITNLSEDEISYLIKEYTVGIYMVLANKS